LAQIGVGVSRPRPGHAFTIAEMGPHAMANMTPAGQLHATSLRDQGTKLAFMSEHALDRVDRAIVARLQSEGRIANVDLADAISLSPSACLRRVKALEASGIIAGYRAEVSRQRAGLGLTVFLGLKVEAQSQETAARIEQALLAIPAIVACYLVSGSVDFLVEVAVPDLASYEQLLLGQILTIPNVVQAQSTFAIRTIRSQGPLPLDHWRR
jgi:Lrp/AsnC family transcriptional regulator, leucine-responsive regulatory protein